MESDLPDGVGWRIDCLGGVMMTGKGVKITGEMDGNVELTFHGVSLTFFIRNLGMVMRKAMVAMALAVTFSGVANQAFAAWSFGVMGDTQWSGSDPTGNNVNTVAVNQIKACNAQFVAAGVDFVLQVGDLTDNGSTAGLQTRLDANSALTAAGISFYGLRGNHEDNTNALTFFKNNYIPTSNSTATVTVGPDNASYAVTYKNTKLVLLDILSADSTGTMDSDTTWMNTQLQAADHTQAFVFGHKNLLGQNHKDNEFGGNNEANPTQQNNFITTLQNNDVRYYISGHDHLHYRGEITSPNGQAKTQEIICASDSYKYYTPSSPFSSRDTAVSEQLGQTGYYIYTVDGPRVTVKYYHTTPLSNGDVASNPTWTLGETFGYSLNGKQFLVASGGDLSVVSDNYDNTYAFLTGTNGSSKKTYDGRYVTKDINTGWTDGGSELASNILTLWGMEDIDSATTVLPFTLTMSAKDGYGDLAIARENSDGTWTRLASVINVDGTVSTTLTSDGTFAVVPEPASLGLLAVGLLGLMGQRK